MEESREPDRLVPGISHRGTIVRKAAQPRSDVLWVASVNVSMLMFSSG